MTNQALPGRPPAHDLTAFDLSKRSPEQVARSFARWKAQRKRQAEAGSTRANPLPSPTPAPAGTGDAAPGGRAAAPTREPVKQASSLQYSAPFSDLLAAGSEPTVQRDVWPPVAALRPPPRPALPGRRLKVMSILAGAASVFALAGGALLELTDWRDPVEVAPQVEAAPQAVPRENPAVGSLATAATSLAAVEWKLRPIVDLALMKADLPPPVSPTSERPMPAIQTASKAASASVGDKPALPERKGSAPGSTQFVAKPFVPDQAPAPISAAQETAPVPAPPMAAAVHTGDPRPDALFQHGHANRNETVSDRAASSGKPAAATGSASTIDARSISARSGAAANGGNGDPRGEVSGGARVGIAGEIGAGTPAHASGSESGTNDAGDVSGDSGTNGGGASGGGSSAGAAGGGDVGGAATGANGAGSDTGGDSAGGADPGSGGSGTGGADAGDSGDGDSGEDGKSGGVGGVGGALGAVGDALGGALGGGKGNPDSNDKDQRN